MTLARVLRRLPSAACALALAACAPCPFPQTQPAGPIATEWVEATLRVVQMRTTQGGASGEFEPREVHARPGDLIRFRMADGGAIHNVMFAGPVPGTPAVSLPPESPYLTEQGQSWQVRVTLPPGTYEFACHPHAEAGHRGTLIVEP